MMDKKIIKNIALIAFLVVIVVFNFYGVDFKAIKFDSLSDPEFNVDIYPLNNREFILVNIDIQNNMEIVKKCAFDIRMNSIDSNLNRYEFSQKNFYSVEPDSNFIVVENISSQDFFLVDNSTMFLNESHIPIFDYVSFDINYNCSLDTK